MQSHHGIILPYHDYDNGDDCQTSDHGLAKIETLGFHFIDKIMMECLKLMQVARQAR